MVVENKATVTYVQLLKEDLGIIRLVPKEGPVPEFKGQFFTIGIPEADNGGKLLEEHIQLHLIQKIKIMLN